jgi:hypothetical protein
MQFQIRKEMSPDSPLRELISQLDLPPDASNLDKALALVNSKLAKRKEVVSEHLVSGSSYDRGRKAEKAFRDPGVQNKPSRLTRKEDALLLERVKFRSGTQAAAYPSEVREEVCSFISHCFARFYQRYLFSRQTKSCPREIHSTCGSNVRWVVRGPTNGLRTRKKQET